MFHNCDIDPGHSMFSLAAFKAKLCTSASLAILCSVNVGMEGVFSGGGFEFIGIGDVQRIKPLVFF